MFVECALGRTQWRKGLHLVVGHCMYNVVCYKWTGNKKMITAGPGTHQRRLPPHPSTIISALPAPPDDQFHMFHPVTCVDSFMNYAGPSMNYAFRL